MNKRLLGHKRYRPRNITYNSVCDRCGVRYDASQMRHEWTGYFVCEWCYDPRHPLLDEGNWMHPENNIVLINRPETSYPSGFQCSVSGVFGLADVGTADCAIVGKTQGWDLLGAGRFE